MSMRIAGGRAADCRGQALMEMALLMPFLLLLGLGVIEVSHGLLEQHVVTKLAREGSNLISRNTSLADATAAMKAMSARPVDFDTRSKVIFSVLKKGATTGTANYDQVFVYQRHEYGALAASSKLTTVSKGSYGGPPDYEASNSDNAGGLQVTNISDDLIAARGGMIYVTEIFSTHQILTPLGRFGINFPTTLYSIAYF